MTLRPIRALFVVPDLRVGGAERHLTTLLPHLDHDKFFPSVICIGEQGALYPTLQQAGIHATAMRLGGKRNAVRAFRALVRSMRTMRPDVVIVRGYNAETLGRMAARVARVEHSIVWVHNIGDARPRSRSRILAENILSRSTSSYFGVAEAQRSFLVDTLGYPPEKVRIIHNGVDPALFDTHNDKSVLAEFGIPLNSPVVGIVAALRPEKDHATFLQAAHIVLDEFPSAHFLIVGDGAIRPDLEAICKEFQIAGNIHFAGTRYDIGQLLRGMDVFTLSSATVECFPLALLEAMACARPAVCTNVGGVGEMIDHGKTGYLVPPRDPRKLAARLIELLSHPQVARGMGNAGRNRVETHFSLSRSVTRAERAIEDVVYGRAPINS